jgi:hypothetical protein
LIPIICYIPALVIDSLASASIEVQPGVDRGVHVQLELVVPLHSVALVVTQAAIENAASITACAVEFICLPVINFSEGITY